MILVIPILCSEVKRESDLSQTKKNAKDRHVNGIHVKETGTIVAPDSPLHLSGSYSGYYIFVTDKTINLVRRSRYYYHKMVFTYKSKLENNNMTALSEIKLDEDNSKFLFSSSNNLGGCNAEIGKEYSYKYKL